jgi:hypothetical protein
LFTTTSEGRIANFYTLQAFNRTSRPLRFSLDVLEPRGATIRPLGTLDRVGAHTLVEGRFLLEAPPASLTGPTTAVRLAVRANGTSVGTIETRLLGPSPSERQ